MESRKASRRLPGRLAPVGDGEGAQHLGELKLRELTARLKERRCFKVGDLIKWKPGLANRSFAEFGEPLEVMAILPTPIHDPTEASAGSPYFQEPLDIVAAVIVDDELKEFRVDSRRFELFSGM